MIAVAVQRAAFVLGACASAMAQAPAGWNDLGSEFEGGLREPWSLVALAPSPELALPAEDGVSDAEIESWIDELARTEQPGAGYSAHMDAWQFLPWPDLRGTHSHLLPARRLAGNEALRRLEELGPRALPHLLAHLDDPRPTRLWFKAEERYGFLRLDRRAHGNPLNAREAAALGEWIVERWSSTVSDSESFKVDYEVKVGDLCFVALGQIVNRPHYAAGRYQPSGHTSVTSPVEDPELAEMLRAAWGSNDPRRNLWESLLLDFRTRGQGTDTLQTGAAARLAYYYPDSAAALLARRLDGLQGEEGWDPVARFFNGVDASELLDALCWCGHPVVAAAWQRAVQRGSVPPALDALLGGAPGTGVEPGEWLAGRFAYCWEIGDDEAAFEVLHVSLRFEPEDFAPLFEAALAHPDPVRRARTCRWLARAPVDTRFAIEPLKELLTDRRPGGGSYVMEAEGWRGYQLRVSGFSLTMGLSREAMRNLDLDLDELYDNVLNEVDFVAWDELTAPEPVFTGKRLPLRVRDEALIALACITGVTLDLATDHDGLDAQARPWRREH